MRGDVHVRFGGEYLETYYSNIVRRWVLTLLDFCFSYKGKQYNYPTLLFYQISYELAVMWQASRRHYRLNQKEECRTYYLAYEQTLQTAALEIMAAKQVATSAIQGKFSTEGLSAMAKGVDARAQLAAALAESDFSSRESLDSMFDVLNAQRNASSEDGYEDYVPPATFYEIVDLPAKDATKPTFESVVSHTFDDIMPNLSPVTSSFGFGSWDTSMDDFLNGGQEFNFSISTTNTTEYRKSTKKHKTAEGQLSLLDFLAV